MVSRAKPRLHQVVTYVVEVKSNDDTSRRLKDGPALTLLEVIWMFGMMCIIRPVLGVGGIRGLGRISCHGMFGGEHDLSSKVCFDLTRRG